YRAPLVRKPATNGARFGRLRRGRLTGRNLTRGLGLGVVACVQRLGPFAPVAVDRDALQAELPGVEIRLLDVLDRRLVRQVHGLQETAADQLLVLDQRQVRLDAGRVAVHHQPDRPGRRQDGRLRVPVAVALAEGDGVVPGLAGCRDNVQPFSASREGVCGAA